MNQDEKSCFPSISSAILPQKPGFLTRIELYEGRKELFAQCEKLEGELILIEVNYLERTCFGTPRMDPMYAEAATYILGTIDTTVKLEVSVVPIGASVSWEKYRENFFEHGPNSINIRTLRLVSVSEGGAFYRIIAGDAAVKNFLEEFAQDKRNGGADSILVFWKAARMLDVDLSAEIPLISEVLEEMRNKALKEYVQKKIDLCSSKSDVKFEGGIVSIPVESFFLKNPLLQLGLSEEAITYRAKELALEKLGF